MALIVSANRAGRGIFYLSHGLANAYCCAMKIACLFCCISSVALAVPPVPPDADEAAYPAIERFVEVLEAVRKRHPDADRVAYDRLVNHALEGMLSSLDPHSSFIHPEMAGQMKANQQLDPESPLALHGFAPL